MNKWTKIRLALTICAIIAVTILVIKWLCIPSVVLGAFIIIMLCVNHWYNNDYTPEHCEATGLARIKRKENTNKSFIGERFFDEEDDEVVEDE